jgi:hypothetical protein
MNVKLVFHCTIFSESLFPLERACAVNPEGCHVLFFEEFMYSTCYDSCSFLIHKSDVVGMGNCVGNQSKCKVNGLTAVRFSGSVFLG